MGSNVHERLPLFLRINMFSRIVQPSEHPSLN